jgi:plasmid maintenance system antidote protein VapI
MKFPNLVWAASTKRVAHYQLAAAAEVSESRFSRCLGGRAKFTPAQRVRIAAILGYPAFWLFREARPPIRSRQPNSAIESMSA